MLRRAAIGDRHGHTDVGIVRVGGEGLRAVQNPAIALTHGGCACACGIFGLGEGPASQPLTGHKFREVTLFLLFGTGFVNVITAERRVRREDDPHRAIHARKFLDDDGVFDVTESRAAVLFGKNRAHVTELAQLLDDFERKSLRLVPLHDVRPNFRFRELAHGFAKVNLLRRVVEFHGLTLAPG